MTNNSVIRNLYGKNRVEAFSDGIFAIIITLLVLEIKVPHIDKHQSSQELIKVLLDLFPKFVGWIISFFTIAVIWVNHHKIFKQLKNLDSGIFWWNAVLLLWASFIPFPTAVLGDYPDNRVSALFYVAVMALMAASFAFLRFYVIRRKEMLEDSVDMTQFRKGTYSSVFFGPFMYLLGAALGFIHPYLSFALFLGIPINFIFSETGNTNNQSIPED